MALLNPPEVRPSILVIITRYLASRRGQRDQVDRLLATLAPRGLAGANPDLDVRRNLSAATELGIVVRSGDDLSLGDGVLSAARRGDDAVVAALRGRALADQLNTAPWGSQVGARDLTNALSWFLTFPASAAPIQMEGPKRSAKDLQERDFGPRQSICEDDDSGGWPIGNPTRWNSFRWWAASLGFAWVSPRGYLVPDPTRAIRSVLPDVHGEASELTAREFIVNLAGVLPVLDSGRYREFVERNWRRQPVEQHRLTAPLSDALERLRSAGTLIFDDRADAQRVTRDDGSTFSHVRIGRKQ